MAVGQLTQSKVPVRFFLITGNVPVNNLFQMFIKLFGKSGHPNPGTVPANKEYAAGTVPANKKYTAGKVPINMEYAASTLKNLKFQKVSPFPLKYVLVRPQKGQNYVQRSIVTVIPEGNQFPVISPL